MPTEYEQREIRTFLSDVRRASQGSLEERKESAKEFLGTIDKDPGLVAERIGWLLGGNYGHGAAIRAEYANRVADKTVVGETISVKSPDGKVMYRAHGRVVEKYSTRDPRKKRREHPEISRVEVGPTGATVWHLQSSHLIILWGGPGSRLRIGYPRGSLSSIDHSSASGHYRTRAEAQAAVNRFLSS